MLSTRIIKILLIDTNKTYDERTKDVSLSLPLGPLYLAAILENDWLILYYMYAFLAIY